MSPRILVPLLVVTPAGIAAVLWALLNHGHRPVNATMAAVLFGTTVFLLSDVWMHRRKLTPSACRSSCYLSALGLANTVCAFL